MAAITLTTIQELAMLIESATLEDLQLRQPVGGAAWSPDLMTKKAGRPPVGVQGRILDAMDDETITRAEATELLKLVQHQINGDAHVMCRITPEGDVMAMGAAPQPKARRADDGR
jgi:hypothetical protein